MKLNTVKNIAFDWDRMVMTFTGNSQLGRSADVQVSIQNPEEFVSKMTAAVYEVPQNTRTGAGVIMAEGVSVSGHDATELGKALVLGFDLPGGGSLRLGLSLGQQTDESMSRIQFLFQAALDELTRSLQNQPQ